MSSSSSEFIYDVTKNPTLVGVLIEAKRLAKDRPQVTFTFNDVRFTVTRKSDLVEIYCIFHGRNKPRPVKAIAACEGQYAHVLPLELIMNWEKLQLAIFQREIRELQKH